MFPSEPLTWVTARDAWLVNRYLSPREDAVYYPDGDDRRYPPKELIAEVDRAYFHLSLQDDVDQWFTDRDIDISGPTIPKLPFFDLARKEFGRPERPKSVPAELPKKGMRYPTDDDLVAEAIEGIKNKQFPNAQKAAEALAPRAEGGRMTTEASKVDRLRSKIRGVLKPRAP